MELNFRLQTLKTDSGAKFHGIYSMAGRVAQSVAVRLKSQGPQVRYPVRPHTLVSLPLIQEGQLSVTGESMCTKYWFTAWTVEACPGKVCHPDVTLAVYRG